MSRQRLYLGGDGLWHVFYGGADKPGEPSGPVPRSFYDGKHGTFKPSEATSGIPVGTALEEFGRANQTITVTGSESLTLQNKILRCDIDWRSTGQLLVENCYQRGWNKTWTSNSAWFRTDNNPGVRNVTVRDTLVKPDYATPYANAFLGPDFTAVRNIIEDVTDGFGVRRPLNFNSANRVRIWGNIVRRLSYFTPDPATNNRANTHNDCIQLFAGWDTEIIGNLLLGTISDTVGTEPFGVGTGSGRNLLLPAGARPITITPTANVRVDATIDRNWLDYGAEGDIVVTLGNDPTGTTGQQTIITRNQHGRNQPLQTKDGVTARRALKIDNRLIVPGFNGAANSVTPDTVNGSIFEDDRSPILVYKGAF